MRELTETIDQAACPVENTPPGISTGVKVMEDREGGVGDRAWEQGCGRDGQYDSAEC